MHLRYLLKAFIKELGVPKAQVDVERVGGRLLSWMLSWPLIYLPFGLEVGMLIAEYRIFLHIVKS